jgi:hypothetical protein
MTNFLISSQFAVMFFAKKQLQLDLRGETNQLAGYFPN